MQVDDGMRIVGVLFS